MGVGGGEKPYIPKSCTYDNLCLLNKNLQKIAPGASLSSGGEKADPRVDSGDWSSWLCVHHWLVLLGTFLPEVPSHACCVHQQQGSFHFPVLSRPPLLLLPILTSHSFCLSLPFTLPWCHALLPEGPPPLLFPVHGVPTNALPGHGHVTKTEVTQSISGHSCLAHGPPQAIQSQEALSWDFRLSDEANGFAFSHWPGDLKGCRGWSCCHHLVDSGTQ